MKAFLLVGLVLVIVILVVAVVADWLIGQIEKLNPAYVELARKRIGAVAPLLSEEVA